MTDESLYVLFAFVPGFFILWREILFLVIEVNSSLNRQSFLIFLLQSIMFLLRLEHGQLFAHTWIDNRHLFLPKIAQSTLGVSQV